MLPLLRPICVASFLLWTVVAAVAELPEPETLVKPMEGLPDGELRFDRLGIDDGISGSSISSIIQDRRGYMWFGGQSGLDRYDGYGVDAHVHDPFDTNSLVHNQIQTMYRENDGDVFWIGTYGGLNRFHPETGEFRRYVHEADNPQSLSNNVVTAIARGGNKRLWVGTLDGLNRLQDEGEGFHRYVARKDEEGTLPDNVIRALTVDARGRLWIGSYGGLSRYRREQDTFETVATNGTEKGTAQELPSPYVMSIVPDPADPDVLWLGTWNGGVSRLDVETGNVRTLSVPEAEIYTMMFDSSGLLWVGTWGQGLYVVDTENDEFRHVRAAERQVGVPGLSHDVIYSLAEDRSGIVWIGTNGGGVNRYVPWKNQYRLLAHDPDDPTGLPPGKIIAAHADEDGRTWIGTYRGGLARLGPHGEVERTYHHDESDPGSLSNDIVNDVYRDSSGRLWIGTNEGLNRFDPEEESFERIRYGGEPRGEDVVLSIHEGPSGRLWLGTHTGGLVVYDPDTGASRVFRHDPDDPGSLSDNLVRSVMHDAKGDAWVATNYGLNRLDRDGEEFIRYTHDPDDPDSLSSNNIRTVFEDSEGRLWIATMGGGVNRYHRDTDSFSHMMSADGLVSDQLVGILEDHSGRLWFATNRGLSIYDPEDGTLRTRTAAGGLLSNDLTDGLTAGADGTLYFGSVDGLTMVDPTLDSAAGFVPPLVITRFTVMGQERPLERTVPAGGPAEFEPVLLNYGESFFSFEFAALDYSSPEQNRYSYMLEGFDTEWIDAGERNFGSYTNLDPGRYTLRVTGAGSRGNRNEEGVSLPLIVRPPWWRTGTAYGGYAVAGATAVALLALRIRRRRRQAELQLSEQERLNQELDRKVRQRTSQLEASREEAERATKAKGVFLANMSHEIRTPLNGLSGMLSLLGRTQLDERQRDYLEHSKLSAENLTTLVNDLLDFERIEAGKLHFCREPFSLTAVVKHVCRLFETQATEKELELSVRVDLGGAPDLVLGDRGRFAQVLTNLVSNAVKYTDEGDVTIELTSVDTNRESGGSGTTDAGASDAGGGSDLTRPRRYRVEVRDSGVGIDAAEREHIFEQFTRLEGESGHAVRGVGLGLAIVRQVVTAMGGTVTVESEVGAGSRFRVELLFGPAPELAVAGPTEDGKCLDANVPPKCRTDEKARPEARTTLDASRCPEAARADREDGAVSVLICEDEAINRLYLTRLLETFGYKIEVAIDGVEAVERVQAGTYDLVLMDVGMPRMSGPEATRRLRAHEREKGLSRTPVIALTAHTYDEDVRNCREAGMDGFVSKPIRESALAEEISRFLG